ncbi:MAG: hypothetical protein EBZ47_07605 [Chlamydiae bacterium]|nr:hypothetical protein [Chlamydiota bacterium]
MLITALATPLHEDYSLDIKSFHRLLQHQKRGADGVIIAGTTGQGSLLSFCPVILYNNPSRVGVAIENCVYDAVKGHKNLLGVKESMGKSSLNGINIPVFCGDDDKIFSYKKQGAIGAISVLSNVFVETVKKALCLDSSAEETLQLLIKLFVRVNPLPMQYILKRNHLFQFCRVKEELGALEEGDKETIEKILEEAWTKLALAF